VAVLSELIMHEKPLATGAEAVYKYSPKLERRFRFVSRFGEEVLLHRVSPDKKFIYLPRAVCPIGVKDERDPGEVVDFPLCPTPREHQEKLFAETLEFLQNGQSGQISAYTGWGKSKDPDEPVLMFDGSIKKARDVQVGDKLMGPDSKPRNVTNVNFGYGPMVRIVPNKGRPWKCNDVHILSLKCTADCHYGKKGEIVNVTVKDWMSWPDAKKHVFKLWRTGVEFPEAKQLVDPYFVGVLLGDGGMKHSINVTTMDPEIEAEVRRQAEFFGATVREERGSAGKAVTLHICGARGNANRCALRWELQCLGLTSRKFIPRKYKIASRAQRLQLLAGLLDTDGYLNNGVFEIASVHEKLATDIEFLARSLGFGVSVGQKMVNGKAYARIMIYGETHLIPTRLPRKMAEPRRQVKDALMTGFRVEELGDGEYRGIALDGDHLYLLGDLTVTHNTVLGYYLAHKLRRKTLVITTKEDIYYQWLHGACGKVSPYNEKGANFLGLKEHEVGEIRGDKCEVVGTKFCVAMIQSLSKDGKYPDWIVKGFGFVIFDECFHPDHELLTQEGWKPVADVTKDDQVMAFDAETGACQFEPVLRTVERPFNGSLVRVHGQKFDTITTPGHEQPLRRRRGDQWFLDRTRMGDLCLHSRVQLPIAGTLKGEGSLSDLERLRIAFEADGHHLYTAKKTGRHTYRFSFRRGRKIVRLRELLASLGWDFSLRVNARGDTNITFQSDLLLSKDFDWFDPTTDGGRNNAFLEELQEWDGWASEVSSFWQHPCKARAEWVQTLAQLAGRDASVCKVKNRWRVRWSAPQTWLESDGLHREELPYDGPVHCVTVPSGNVVTRLHGTISISGNCHRVPADQFSSVASMFPAKLRLAVSATNDRKDGKELVVQAHIGPIRARTDYQLMVPKVLRFASGWDCPKTLRTDPVTGEKRVVRIPHEPGKTTHIEKMLAADPLRNQLIGRLVAGAHAKGRTTVVFSTLIDHLRSLHRILVKHNEISGKEIGFYIGCSTKAEREQRDREKVRPILLSTYNMMSEGTSLDWLDTAVLAMPRSDVAQAVGRIRREFDDKLFPVVMDVVDDDSPVFSGYAGSRLRWYNSIGAEVKDMV